jgi:hypothetical protein
MKSNKFVIAITLIALLSGFFGAGGTKTALAEASTLAEVAGMTAWYNVGGAITPADFVSGFSTVEYQTADYIVGTVDIPIYVAEYNPHVLVHSSGYILAFYPNTDPAAKMIDVIAKSLNTTLLEYAVVMVGAAGGTTISDVTYYDFGNPAATDMLVLAENRADGENFFSLQMPANIIDEDGIDPDESVIYDYIYYDKSYSFYQTYLPEFNLNEVNFVLDNADFVGPGYYGAIFGHFYEDPVPETDPVITDLLPDTFNEFTVDSGSTSAFGAVVLTYSYILAGVPDIVGADSMMEFLLTAPDPALGSTTFDYLPGPFTKISPADGATGQLLNPTLEWSDSTSPNYEYCIDTTDDDACVNDNWVSTPTGVSQVTLSGLHFDTTYYWQVRASNSSGEINADDGTWWSFTTEQLVAPVDLRKVSPFDGALSLSPNGVVLDWDDSYGAYSYEYCLSETQSCTAWVDVGTNTSVTLSNLKFQTTYNWQVRAVNDSFATEADSGDMWSFTTLDTFSKLRPVDDAIDQKTRATLTWERLGSSTYEYCIDEVDDDVCASWVSVGTATNVSLRLTAGETYFWQVRASNGTTTLYANDDNDPLTSDWWSFTVKARVTPSPRVVFEKISPQDGSTDVSTTVTLRWLTVTGATNYQYCLKENMSEECIWTASNTANSATITELTSPTTYYWQVRATLDGEFIYADSVNAFWEFTTQYNKISPANHADGLLVNDTKLDWQDVTGATEYQYCLDTDDYCNNWVTAGTASEITLSGLSYRTTYYWQVRAFVGTAWIYADGSASAYWRFTTEELVKISPVDGALDQPINITLDWDEVSGAIEYQYCLYLDVICTEWVSTAESSTATITGLDYSTTYHWQVRANVGTVDNPIWIYADGGELMSWDFTTIADPNPTIIP